MTTRDIESRLDDALTRLSQGASRDTRISRASDVSDLISLAEYLQILAPAPEPRLEEGRRKFLQEAARMAKPPAEARLRLSFAIAAMVVLIVGIVMVAAAMSGRAGSFANPSLQATMTPTHAPTFSVTPSSMFTPNNIAADTTIIMLDASQTYMPVPAPTPTPAPPLRQIQRLITMTRCSSDA